MTGLYGKSREMQKISKIIFVKMLIYHISIFDS